MEELLRTGSFRTSRSRSPNPNPNPHRYDLPVRGTQDYSSSYKPTSTRTANTGLRIVRPPPPSVEDEASALAKEHGQTIAADSHDEEPKHRGDVDQTPLILPVLENNPERRFVIVTGTDSEGETAEPKTAKTKYDANTGRKKVPASSSDEDGKENKRRPELTKRKSHTDLPRLDTHPDDHGSGDVRAPINRSNSRRHREKAHVSQESRDYSDRNGSGSSRPLEDHLSPEPIIRTSGGRERAYWDLNSAANGGVPRRRSMRGDARAAAAAAGVAAAAALDSRHSTATQSAGPGLHRRAASTTDRPTADLNPLIAEFKYSDPDHALAFMMQDDDIPPRRSKRGERTSNSPPYPPSEQDRRPSRSPSFVNRRQSFREQGQYYGDDSFKSQRSDHDRPRRPTLERGSSSLLSPDQAWPHTRNRSKSGSGSPLPSPRITQGGEFPDGDYSPLPSPRSPRSATFPPTERESRRYEDRSVSPSPPAGTSPPRRTEDVDRHTRSRANSRAATLNSFSNSSVSVALPLPIPVGRSDVSDRRPSPAPPSPSIPRHDSVDTGSPKQYWQPPPFDPSKQNVLLDKPITSYRRYSEDVLKGVLPQLPDCSWKSPGRRRPSDGQFLTLPRAGFNVCFDCHSAVFANTDFGRLFVPATIRPDQPISCDFGSSPWYRIAYLMTLKYRWPDLRLLQGISSVAQRQQPCAGDKPANRIWYSVMDPKGQQKPIRTFNACTSCAKMAEVLLPNLAGIFVPLSSASEPTRGVCELHFSPDRKRFTEYFDILERASDRALSRRTAPNIQDLAERIKDLSELDECPRNKAVANQKWHIMQNLPEFTVCDECFDEVVWSYIRDKDKDHSDIPGYFYNKRQVLPMASCMLYSERMRDVFRRACRRDDMDYLEAKVKEKLKLDHDIKSRIAQLERDDQDDPWVQRELQTLTRQLKENE